MKPEAILYTECLNAYWLLSLDDAWLKCEGLTEGLQ